jgi:hypothetical protein
MLSGFSFWMICILYINRCSCLCRTLCNIIHGTCSSLDAWQMDLIRLLWNVWQICSSFLLETLSHSTPDHVYISCCQKLVTVGLDGFLIWCITSVHLPIASMYHNECLHFCIPHNNMRSLLRRYLFLATAMLHSRENANFEVM